MSDEEIIKKNFKRKNISKNTGELARQKKKFPTLAHIVLSNGFRVDIPKLPINISELTTYDHMRCALELAGLAMCALNQIESRPTPSLAMSYHLDPIRLNLEDLLNHLHDAITVFYKTKE